MKNHKSARAVAPMTDKELFNALISVVKKFSATNPNLGIAYEGVLSTESPYVTFQLMMGEKDTLRQKWAEAMVDDMDANCDGFGIILSDEKRGVVCAWFDVLDDFGGVDTIHGTALCCPTDKFDGGIGLAVAWAKARGYDIPDFI